MYTNQGYYTNAQGTQGMHSRHIHHNTQPPRKAHARARNAHSRNTTHAYVKHSPLNADPQFNKNSYYSPSAAPCPPYLPPPLSAPPIPPIPTDYSITPTVSIQIDVDNYHHPLDHLPSSLTFLLFYAGGYDLPFGM